MFAVSLFVSQQTPSPALPLGEEKGAQMAVSGG